MNMSYCRFQNTVTDLYDCYNSDGMFEPEELSEEERKARRRLIDICQTIAAEFDWDEDDD